MFGRTVERADELEGVLRQALDHPGPALVSVKVANQELSMPPSIDFEQAKGFGIYLLKTILNGRGNEILDLVKTNVREVF
jgi:pyruvate dehydrogenase (quinone)